MSKSDRQSRIIAELRLSPALRVHELAEMLGVSTETIRRDFAELDERGLINRTYGGATRPITTEPAVAERETLMIAERQRIASAAVALIETNEILMIGGGATTLHFARRLAAEVTSVTVITHAFSIAAAIATNPLHKVIMLPGQYDGREGLIHGPDTIDTLQRYRAHKAVLGATGLTGEGPSDASIGPGMVYGAMLKRAGEAIIVADHAKHNRPSLSVYGSWGPAMTLVTDAEPQGELKEAIDASRSRCHVA